jgi:hypothetical protein
MKKLYQILSAVFVVFGLIATPAVAFAQDPSDPLKPACDVGKASSSAVCNDKSDPNKNPISGPDGIIVKGSRLIAILTGVACVVVIIVAGIRYATSAGDPNSVNGAKNAILYALVGLVVAGFAPFIVGYVLNKF